MLILLHFLLFFVTFPWVSSLFACFFLFVSLVFFTSSLVFFYCQMFSLFFLWFWLICQWFCCFNARKLKKWLKNRETMTRKWQENDRKTWQKKHKLLASFIFLDSKDLRFFCHVFVMFDWCPWCFHDSSVWCTIWISMRHLECLLNTGDEIGFLKNGWSKSLWKWGATKLSSHALGMPPSSKKKKTKKNHPELFSGIYRAF